MLETTKKKLDQASADIGKAGTHTRAIERKLRDVEALPGEKAKQVLGDLDVPDTGDASA